MEWTLQFECQVIPREMKIVSEIGAVKKKSHF